ncbi:MAG: hypothetical protein QXI58_05330 [Candidatus Micrarchaeia archaeon]
MEEKGKNEMEVDKEKKKKNEKSAKEKSRRTMTRSIIKNICAWFKSCFWDKIFVKKTREYKRKIKTPETYYKTKERMQKK